MNIKKNPSHEKYKTRELEQENQILAALEEQETFQPHTVHGKRELEQENQMFKELVQSIKDKKSADMRHLFSISHDLKSPLGHIQENVKVPIEKQFENIDETKKEKMGTVESNASTLRELAQQILDYQDDEEAFTVIVGKPTYFCVGIIDIVDSTKAVARLPVNKSSRYYEIFQNNMAKVVRRYNGQVLKTMGDSLLFYFPDTSFSERKFGFLSCLECGFSLMDTHKKLKKLLSDEMLPTIDFRISFDYGNVTMMRNTEWAIDLVGPTINTCAKINGVCPVNGAVVGNDLYEKTKNFREYKFKNTGSFSAGLKHTYPVFIVSRN